MQKLDDNNDRQSDKNKTKRRARSTDEKLAAIKYYKAVKSYKQVAKEHGCSRKMIRTWASQEQNLLSLRGEKTGKNLKRLEGAGKNYAMFSYTWDSDDVLTLSYVLGSSFDPKLINFGDDDNDKKRESNEGTLKTPGKNDNTATSVDARSHLMLPHSHTLIYTTFIPTP
ncbi:unnamed protein product [Didymodactylos carnosus]|uniref:Insertion element IS150 protein InsJ-like helix-turn-helix domain-containing protein n=1 Tax=Didymodactylos carnosus TaxID=1234261 RepID=A0A814J1A4_9BILA|nr:unnamed protein product [Didymodactylos carnosus]CAF3801683.1 unnamed protein product [Didymodactylos carnosus]